MKIFREESHLSNIVNIHTNYTVPFTDVFIRLRSEIRKSVQWTLNEFKKIIKSENLKSKFKNWYKIKIQTKIYFRFFNFDFSIFNVEFTCFSLLQGFSRWACISNFLGNHFLTLWTLFVAEFTQVPFWANMVIFYYLKEHFLMIPRQNPWASILSNVF